MTVGDAPGGDCRSRAHADEPGARGDDRLTLEEASSLLGVPSAAIQSWERRYHLTLTGDQSGPRYSSDAIRVLRRMRDYVGTGHGTAEAASVADAPPTTSPERLISALLAAAEHLQPADIGHILDTAHRLLGVERTIDDVLLPALRQIGERWARGDFSVGQEHAASQAIRAWLARVGRQGGPVRRSQPIVLACGPREQHTLALESLAVLLRGRGWECLLLGARTPAEALRRTVSQVAPAAVVVVSHLPATRRSAVHALRTADDRRAPQFVAGSAFRHAKDRAGLSATYLGENVTQAADLICASVASGRMGR